MKPRHLVWIRRISQTFFLLLFIFLLVQSRLPQYIDMDYSQLADGNHDIRIQQPITFFFQLDPLVWLTSLISGHVLVKGFAWAITILVLTLFLGRVFCGFICPFGTIHHLISVVKPALTGKHLLLANRKSGSQKIKYAVLIGILAAALAGLNIAGIMDPISLLFRSLALSVLPGVGIGLYEFSGFLADSENGILNTISDGADILAPIFGDGFKAFQTGWFIGLLFLIIVFLNRIRPRFWCRILCPLGALLGICSGFSILRLEKDDDKCTQCNQCIKSCQGAAEPLAGTEWQSSECITCFNCYATCPEDALVFRFQWPAKVKRTPDMGKRAVLGGLTAGLSLHVLGRLDGGVHKVSDTRLIRPPGSIPEKDFLKLCQRCGLCMKACPTNVINPTLTEAGMAGFWTPTLLMTQGYCEHTCTLCGSVCPTHAIKEISAHEKIAKPIRIGSAYIDRGRCLPWSGNGPCIVCEEFCPTSPKAIYLYDEWVNGPRKEKIKVKLPQVNLKQCTGCGICENKCPVKGKPAIRVIAAGESRSRKNRILL